MSSQSSANELVLGVDYVIDAGKWVFTAAYHLKRGYCCDNRCRECPYEENRMNPVELAEASAPACREFCARCNKTFECNPGKCWCDRVQVSIDALVEMQLHYDSCLCPDCLKSIADAYASE